MGSLAGPLIQGGAAALGGIFGGSGPSSQQKNAMTAQTNLANQQTALSKQLGGYAQGAYSMGAPALNQALNYYKTLAGGSTSAIQGLLAPQINQLAQSYSGARSQIQNNPLITGGVQQTALARLAQQQAGQLGLMPFEARQGANQALGSLGQGTTQLATGLGGAATGAAGSASNALSQYLNQAYQQQLLQQQQSQQLGGALTQAFVPYLLQKYANPGASNPASMPDITSLAGPYLAGTTTSGPGSAYDLFTNYGTSLGNG